MKIGKFIGYSTMALLVTYCIGSTFNDVRKKEEEFIANTSKEIRNKDVNRHNRIVNNILSGTIHNDYKMWNKELTEMKDSLRIDSLCKKAYFDGAQMVRDSITNTKDMVKLIK